MSWRRGFPLWGRGIGSSNDRFQPVGLLGAMCRSSFLPRDVRDVHHIFFEAMHIEHIAAWAFSESMRRLSRSIVWRIKPLASIPQGILACGPISLIAPCLKIGLSALRQKRLPCRFEVGAGLLKIG